MCLRELEEDLRQRKIVMIAALWANGNLGGDDLNNAVKEVEGNFDRAVQMIWGGGEVEEEKIDWDDPFMAGAKRGMDKLDVPEFDGQPDDAVSDAVQGLESFESDQVEWKQ